MSAELSSRIGIDWGSTSFRAYRFDQTNQCIDSVLSKSGIKNIPDSQFETKLFELIGHWMTPESVVLLSGMITSRNGWIETPYVNTPTILNGLLDNAISKQVRDVTLQFLPGLSQNTPHADVMRGEELQLLGVLSLANINTVILPGTHSKWAQLSDGEVLGFQTFVTGELFDVLLNSTLVGQLAHGEDFNDTVFCDGVKQGFTTNALVGALFQCRAGVLLQSLDACDVHSFLSGLLIGNEIREGLYETHAADAPIALVGNAALCSRYTTALTALSIPCRTFDEDVTAAAFARLFDSVT